MGYYACSILLWVLTTSSTLVDPFSFSSLVIAPHCSQKCGNTNIPYPFGIEDGCHYVDKDHPNDYPMMKVKCNYSSSPTQPPMLILGENIEILSISVQEGEIRINSNVSYNCYSQGASTSGFKQWLNLVEFTLSSTKNKLVVLGCDTYAWFTGTRYNKSYYTGCMTQCDHQDDVDEQCDGVGCCLASIPADGITNITIIAASFSNHTAVDDFNPCSAAFPVANDSFVFHPTDLTKDETYYYDKKLPIVFDWAIGNENCSVAQAEGSCLCKNNTDCIDFQGGYRCQCQEGYTAENPYLPQGCTDINECEGANDCEKSEYCHNTNGSYFCRCPEGNQGNGNKTIGCTIISNEKSKDSKPWLIPVAITAGIGGSIIILLLLGFLAHWRRGEIQLKQLRERCFEQNGGKILDDRLSNRDDFKIFTVEDLDKASDNYSETHIIGRGGFGVFYRGWLPNNQQVAIKRSLKVDPNQVEQFINEILVLSKINNRNVVKLLGCCLETDVPLLVYEFINNGTLYEHLNDRVKAPLLSWHVRLRIASEVAEVLSYLHTTISTPIIHRDMKTMNILLDESYTAKVTDFGASRLVPSDQCQFATMVLGTLGYLDPEYMQTSEFTDKSDVYSFGVVLVELITRKKALSYDRPEVERCLAMYFLLKMKEDRLFDIIDRSIGNNEVEREQIKEVANLAKWCLRLKGEERPSMREVALELEGIKRTGKHPWHCVQFSSTDEQQDCEYLLGGIASKDSGHSGGNQDSDLYPVNTFAAPIGDGR